MRYKLIFLLTFVILFSCGKKKETNNTNLKEAKIEFSHGIKVLNYAALEPLLHKKDNKTYIINFWATWCKPCVDELPAFEKISTDYKDKNVEVLLVSLDFSNQIENQLIPFIKENNLTPEVVVLDDPDQNKWIDAIDPSWSGSIPATIIYNKDNRAFYEQSFDEQLLLEELHKFIK